MDDFGGFVMITETEPTSWTLSEFFYFLPAWLYENETVWAFSLLKPDGAIMPNHD